MCECGVGGCGGQVRRMDLEAEKWVQVEGGGDGGTEGEWREWVHVERGGREGGRRSRLQPHTCGFPAQGVGDWKIFESVVVHSPPCHQQTDVHPADGGGHVA